MRGDISERVREKEREHDLTWICSKATVGYWRYSAIVL
jgi:hypothetical protein